MSIPIDEFTFAKVSVTLRKLFKDISKQYELLQYEKHFQYKKKLGLELSAFSKEKICSQEVAKLRKVLEGNSFIYSYCFDHYILLPPILLVLGYDITILVSDDLLKGQFDYFDIVKEKIGKQMNRELEVEYLTNTTPNLLYKIKERLVKGRKVLLFADGNKGYSNSKTNNLLISKFKGHNVFFHQGIGVLSYMLKQSHLTGIIVTKNEEKISFTFTDHNILSNNLHFKEYVNLVSNLLVNELDSMINRDNVYKWNNLLSVYQWFVDRSSNPNVDYEYFPFQLNGKYYAMEHDTFNVYSIEKRDYNELKKKEL